MAKQTVFTCDSYGCTEQFSELNAMHKIGQDYFCAACAEIGERKYCPNCYDDMSEQRPEKIQDLKNFVQCNNCQAMVRFDERPGEKRAWTQEQWDEEAKRVEAEYNEWQKLQKDHQEEQERLSQ
ncbi:MAG TPA: hypothetical protein ENG14_04300 [Thermodesulforhabdus norvegica]|uniref:Uncharacterized protein n=1 Tax=Thermodesulforhabdus norvegica TaxID=39841 RepID=A0A7C0WVN1_9BACT|nr:hypothetical protein [Thermodesulforhabdus norvegica]